MDIIQIYLNPSELSGRQCVIQKKQKTSKKSLSNRDPSKQTLVALACYGFRLMNACKNNLQMKEKEIRHTADHSSVITQSLFFRLFLPELRGNTFSQERQRAYANKSEERKINIFKSKHAH